MRPIIACGWLDQGLGRTLGEALVSEGLAGHFTQLVLGTTPAPWECAFGIDVLMRHFPSAEQLGSPGCSHRAWFFGVGGPYPRWLGYTLGHAIVEEWRLKCSPAVADLIHVPAAEVLSATVPRFANTERYQAHLILRHDRSTPVKVSRCARRTLTLEH